MMFLHCAQLYNREPGPFWLHPILKTVKSPGTKLGQIIRAVLPGAAATFAKHMVSRITFPQNLCAGGIRPGCINTLCTMMPGFFVTCATGHEIKNASALYEYLDPSYALLQPAAIVLSGLNALPWGQLGKGPVAPSLEPLASFDQVALENMILAVFHLHENVAPELLPNGRLW